MQLVVDAGAVAARVAKVHDLIAGTELSFEDRGEHSLKGIPGAWRLYAHEPILDQRLLETPSSAAPTS